jgi:hypothetical protein
MLLNADLYADVKFRKGRIGWGWFLMGEGIAELFFLNHEALTESFAALTECFATHEKDR